MATNPISNLLKIYENSVQRFTELVVEVKVLLNSMINSVNMSQEGNKSIVSFLDKLNDKIDGLERINRENIHGAFEDIVDKLTVEITQSSDRCISERCPKKDLMSTLQEDKSRIIQSHENEKKWWKKLALGLMVACAIFMIGMILTATLGSAGVKMWFDSIQGIAPKFIGK